MPEKEMETYSNPLPPPRAEEDMDNDEGFPQAKMTNEDFRKLLMTPRHPHSSSSASSASAPTPQTAVPKQSKPIDEADDAATRRKKKKSYYAKLKKLEEEHEKELALKYRDRAGERRDGVNRDYEQTEVISTTADYRAVAPDAKSGEDYTERRKQLIQESKYLGGDMEHTHLVKGLDYALLEKVRAEICSKEMEDEEMENVVQNKKDEEEMEVQMQFKTKMARNIFRILFRTKRTERNELFLPGRMAYVVDLDDDYGDLDIPNTLIRSKADCPSLESTTTLSTNDIVINKLTQILSYLRQGRKESKKLKKKDKGKLKEEEKPKLADDSIYGEIGDYVPASSSRKERDRKETDRRDRDRDRDRHDRDRDRHERDRGERDRYGRDHDRGRDREREREKDRDRRNNYFEKPMEEPEDREVDKGPESAKEFVRSINERFAGKVGWTGEGNQEGKFPEGEKKPGKEDDRLKKLKTKVEIDSYAECYPGMMEAVDAICDSDDEVDYTKMDQGNKKGPIGRWDFDTHEEYSDYMANKEALPKAAFQYGVKMVDGRRTRRTGPKDEKKELDREWQKIQNIIAKRKLMATEGDRYQKMPKY